MAAKDLGNKYVCFKCGAKFYDLKKPIPTCPKCGVDQREAPTPKTTTRRAPAPRAVEEPAEAPETEDEELEDEEDDEPAEKEKEPADE